MHQREERTLGELFSELASETSTLVRQEVDLAKTELSQKATEIGKDAAMIGVGGFVAYAGFLALLAGIIIGLGQVIPMWASALLVGLIVAGVGYALIQMGINAFKRAQLAPRETIESLKEDAEWLKDQAS